MDKTALVLLVLALLALVVATSASSQHRQRGFIDKRSTNARSLWQPLTDLEGDDQAAAARTRRLVKAYVALKENQDGLHSVQESVEAALDPQSKTYSRHLSWDAVNTLVAPGQANMAKVVRWLKQAGVEKWEVMPTRSWIRINASADVLESLVKCRMRAYTPVEATATEGATVIHRCKEDTYQVPHHLKDIMDFVTPIVGFPKPKAANKAQDMKRSNAPMDSLIIVNPELLLKIYNISDLKESLNVNNTQVVVEVKELFNYQYVDLFLAHHVHQLEGQQAIQPYRGTYQPSHLIEKNDRPNCNVAWIMAMGAFSPTYYYAYLDKDRDEIKVFLDWVNNLTNNQSPPLVNKALVGMYGGDYPKDEVTRILNKWMKLGLHGITIVAPSGNAGAGCRKTGCDYLEVPFPSSPWITTVGATEVHQHEDNSYTETASGFSSGGFSEDFSMPLWQAAQVSHYLKTCPRIPRPTFYNITNCAIPDISAPGVAVIERIGDSTRAAAPMIAGLVSRLNGMRLKAGKSPMGFINPFLYSAASHPGAYQDIIKGNNTVGCCPGFSASQGWDPISGLGTPNFGVLSELAMALP